MDNILIVQVKLGLLVGFGLAGVLAFWLCTDCDY